MQKHLTPPLLKSYQVAAELLSGALYPCPHGFNVVQSRHSSLELVTAYCGKAAHTY